MARILNLLAQSSVAWSPRAKHRHFRTTWCVSGEGHSLGGALATLAAFDIAKELRLTDISVVTFGAPRTGNRAFAREYELFVPDTWHVINAKVTCCPPLLQRVFRVGLKCLQTGLTQAHHDDSFCVWTGNTYHGHP